MSEFRICGAMDPMLEVSLKQGEDILAESGAMVTMDACLDLKGKTQGGIMQSFKRSFLQGESFFQQHISANNSAGKVVLAPMIPGDIKVLELGQKQYKISDGAFLAADNSVKLESKTQGIGKAIFGGTGGFFVMETSGMGKVAVSGFGSIYEMQIEAGKDIIVDNGHVVAWDSSLEYEVTMSTSSSSGIFGKLLNSQTSGEGLVLRFKGSGTVYMCSRNRTAFLGWIISQVPTNQNK